MTSPLPCPVFLRFTVLATTIGLIVGSGASVPVAHAQTVRNAEDLLIVDCLLPGQIRRLGAQATFMSARRPIRTTQADCQIRGGEYVAEDRANYQTALKVWMESAMTGDVEAMNYVGEIYLKGLGTDPDYALAQVWFKKAADKGNNRAKINLGYMYEEGLGVNKDMAQALNLYREAQGITNDELIFSSTVAVELQAKETQITELKQTVATEHATEEQLREQVKQLQTQLDQHKQALESSQHDLEDTQAKLEKVRSQVGTADLAKVDQARSQIQSSADALADAQGSDDATKAANAAQIAQLKAQLASQRAQFQAQIRSMQAHAPAKSKQDLDVMRLLENQLVDKQTEVRTQNRAIASLQQRIGSGTTGSGQVLVGALPSLEMLEPTVVATRGKQNTGVVHGAPGPHDLIGRVTQPQSIAQVTVNNQPIPVGANGAFKTRVNVPAGGASVQVAFVTKSGARAGMDFNLIAQAGGEQASVGGIGGAGAVPANLRLGNNYAVIIGNNTYQDPSYQALKSAASDATAVSQVLKARYGFQTSLLLNASRLEILTALNTMREKLGPDDNLLIYYAGHGELQGRQGYWIPVDAKDNTASTWISNAAISDILTTIKSRHVLVVADSCYSGTMTRAAVPVFDLAAMSADKWNAWVGKMTSGKSRTALTSGGVQPVPDTGSGQHSYFTRAFLNALQDNNRMLEAQRLYREVSSSLALAAIDSPIAQSPGYSPIQFAGHESGDFFFVPKGARTALAKPQHPTLRWVAATMPTSPRS
ncbi:MAG TPA: caspase family protein [Xanthomonadaceae bacterium]|nr:caspase family protein [Xanthomonadaceae bacterium]